MLTVLEDVNEMLGKSVIELTDNGGHLCVKFSDNSCILLTTDTEWGPSSPHVEDDCKMLALDDRLTLGIINQNEYNLEVKSQAERIKERQKQSRYQQYLALKEEFGE